MYEPKSFFRSLRLGRPSHCLGFFKKKENRLDAYYLKRWLAHSLLKENRNKKGKKGNRVRLKDCGEWKLWGRHPLTIEKQAVALSGERG